MEKLIVSFDVVNLYTNNSHDYIIEAIKLWLENFTDELSENIERINN